MKEVKRNFELDIVNLLKKGLNPSKIAIHLNISLPNLSYYLSSLKKQNIIKKIGYGVWEVNPIGEVKILSQDGASQDKTVRGHAFVWKIKANKSFNWLNLLKEKNITYERKGLRDTPVIKINNKKVWLGKNYITIFEPKWNSYFAINPVESKKEAIFELDNTINKLKELFGEFNYKFTCRRQHYGFVNNKEAIHFNKEGKSILIKNEKGYWFSIDHSQNKYNEAETIHPKDADIDGLGYQRLMNSHEKTNFKVTPEYTLEAINGIIQNQQMFDRNMVTHLDVLDRLGKAVNELRNEIKLLNMKGGQDDSTTKVN